jgi:GNAT superfamily N-acetyltransferase
MSGERLQLSVEPDESSEIAMRILALLEDANSQVSFPRNAKQFCAVLRRTNGEIVGGITAQSFWGWLYIVAIAVVPSWRGQGYGRQLMTTAEAWGLECSCHGAWLMTMSFQARTFYERAGYQVFGELPNFPERHARVFMRKSIGAMEPIVEPD